MPVTWTVNSDVFATDVGVGMVCGSAQGGWDGSI